jgi:hypothetical protein
MSEVRIGLTQTVFTPSFLRGETPVGTAKLCVKHGEHGEKCVLCVSPGEKSEARK